MEPVAKRAEDITPEWLTQALQSAGHAYTVTGIRAHVIGTGQMGSTYRLELEYAGNPGPPSLVAKLASLDESTRRLVSAGYAAEVGFYLHLAPRLEVKTPKCWYGAIADGNAEFTLLLDDLAPAAPGVQANGCTIAQASQAVENLLGLHVPLWNDPTLKELTFLMQPNESMAALMGDVTMVATDGFVHRYADALGSENIGALRSTAEAIATWQLARLSPFTAIHGDYRLDNLLFSPSDDGVVAVDWQTAALGPPMRDVAYFLGTSLEIENRRAHEQRLVGDYHAALVRRGVTEYEADRCWEDYRLGQLQGPMITVMGCMYATGTRTDKSDSMFLAMARRSCAAVRDLHSLEVL